MARVKFSPIVTNISGSIGGITFQRNKFGMTMRQRPMPLNPSTARQYLIRQKMIVIQKAWQNLTDAQRLQWDRYMDFSLHTTKHDRSVKLSGHALYLKYQLMRLMCNFPLLTVLTYIPVPTFEPWEKLVISVTDIELRFANPPGISTKYFLMFLTNPRLPNQAFSNRGLRFCYGWEVISLSFILTTDYLANFGVIPTIGDTLHYSYRSFSLVAPVFSGVETGTLIVQSP